jgi:hypothetical protein
MITFLTLDDGAIARRFHEDLIEYLDCVCPDWAGGLDGVDEWDRIVADQRFRLERIQLGDLERASRRPLKLCWVDMDMAGESRTDHPMLLDDDNSVIDGMHRLATYLRDGVHEVEAYVRIQ